MSHCLSREPQRNDGGSFVTVFEVDVDDDGEFTLSSRLKAKAVFGVSFPLNTVGKGRVQDVLHLVDLF